MDLTGLENVLNFINNLLGVLSTVIILIILIIKLRAYHKKTETYDIIRTMIIIWFFCILWFNTWEFLYYNTPLNEVIPSIWMATDYSSIVVQSLSVPIVIIVGLFIVGKINQWKILEIFPFAYFAIIIGLTLLFNLGLLYFISMLVSYLLVLVFLFYTGLRVKDNDALGLAIYFMITMFVGVTESYPKFILGIISYIFGIIFALGYFKPYKKERIE